MRMSNSVRPYRRFMDDKAADSGIDKQAIRVNFMKMESTVDKFRADRIGSNLRYNPDYEARKGMVPSGTTVCTYKLGLNS